MKRSLCILLIVCCAFYASATNVRYERDLISKNRPDTIALNADFVANNPVIHLKNNQDEVTVIVYGTCGEKLFTGSFYKTTDTETVRLIKDETGKYKIVTETPVTVKRKWTFFIML
jgi:hypothetical protein